MRNLYWCEKCPCQIIYCAARFVLWTCMFLFLSRIQTPHPHIKGEYLFTCFAPAFQIYVYICTYVYTLEKHMKILRVYSNVFLRVISAATPHCQVHLRLPDWPRCRGVELLRYSTEVHTIKGHPAVCLEINFIPRQFRQCCRGPEECQRSQNDRIQYWAALVLAVAAGVNIEARKIDSYSGALLLVASGGLAYTGRFRGSTNKFGRVSNVTRHVATHGELRPKCRCSTFAGA